MRFLLTAVNAKYIHSNPAVYSLQAYACQEDPTLKEQIFVAEYTINQQMEDVLADLYEHRPDVIGFSCYIWNIPYIEKLVRELKKLLPQVQIWLGGPEVSFDAEKVMEEYPQLTGIMLGEGEQTFLELAQHYRSGESDEEALSRIAGLAIRKNGKVILTGPRVLTDLSVIPFLYDDLKKFENKILYYESSRGCPFRCSYCLSSIDKKVRLRDLSIVKRELQFFLDQKVTQVKFVDRTFNCNKKHAMEIWEYLLAHDNGITNFHFEIAADILDEEQIRLLNQFRPGAVQLEIGVQSTNEETIREIDRHMDVGLLRQIVQKIHAGHNIHIHLDLIAGLPLEGYASFGHSFDDVYAMEPEQLQLGFLKVLKGSKMHDNCEKYGLVYLDEPPYEVLYTSWLSYEEVRRLKQIEEMVELYYNSNQFVTTLKLLVPKFASPFAFFEELAAYFAGQGYFLKAPARSYRYQVLYDFIREKGLPTELFREALTQDLYLRENCKTRPAFAKDPVLYKEEIRRICQRAAKEPGQLSESYVGCDARTIARMTHIEPYFYDLTTGKKREQESFFLYDYTKKSPLTGEVSVIDVTALSEAE